MSVLFKILRIDPGYPAPFIFCGPDWARDSHGVVAYHSDTNNTEETAAYPISNLSDGNRATFGEITKVGPKTQNYANIRIPLSLSASLWTKNAVWSGMQILCIEMDPFYPISSFRFTYEDPSYGSGGGFLENLAMGWFPDGRYKWGSRPRIDGEYLANAEDTVGDVYGTHGRYLFFPLDQRINGNSGNLAIVVTSVARNQFGVDGSYDNGAWADAVDETIETSDPDPSSNGANNNYAELATVAAGANKNAANTFLGIRPTHEYMYGFHHKQTGTGDSDSYWIQIQYLDKDFSGIGSAETLWSSSGTDTSWTNGGALWIPINYKDAGKRYSGNGSFKHAVPDGTYGVVIQHRLIAHASDALTWQMDDHTFYSTDIQFKYTDYGSHTGLNKILPLVNDQSGTVRIRRVSVFEHAVMTSRRKDSPSLHSDWQLHAPPNPMSLDHTLRGKSVVADFYGNVAGQFIPKAGLKRVVNAQFIMDQAAASYLQDMSNSENEIGLIYPNGDWGEFVILDDVKSISIGRAGRHVSSDDSRVGGPERILTQVLVPMSEV